MPWVIVAGAFSLFQGALLLLFAWEQRRYLRGRAAAPLPEGPFPSVRLIIPCRGVDPQMDANLQALFQLRYPRLELCFVVESLRDAAVAVIERLRQSSRVDCHIVEAGLAVDSGQKVHNLMAACREPRDKCDVLAFVDSDARPHPDWLTRLVQRLANGKAAVVTGYRWYLPVHGDLPSRLISAINNTVIGVLGPHGFNLVWGGAWAIRSNRFDELGLPEAWSGSLSDDLIVSRLVHDAGLRLSYEPHALVVSPAVFTWSTAGEFLRRQFLVVHNYVPRWWHLGFWGGLIGQALFWGLVCTAGLRILSADDSLIPSALALGAYLLGVIRWEMALGGVRPFIPAEEAPYAAVARINVWAWPLVSLLTWMGVVSATFGRTIVWRGIHYSMDSPHRTRVLSRQSAETTLPDPASNVTHFESPGLGRAA